MGKKKSRSGAAGEDWENGSTASTSTWHTCNDGICSQDVIDGFNQAVDDLLEKRASTREKAFAALAGFFRESVRQEDAMQCETTIISRCCNGLKRGGPTEAVLSAQLLGLLLVTHPVPEERHFREAQLYLQSAVNTGDTSEVRVAATDSLAFCCFVAAEDDYCCMEVMEKLKGYWSKSDSRVVSAAIRGWCLLFTRLGNTLSTATVEGVLSHLAALLHHSDVEVRGAAGEALALLYHSCNLKALFTRYIQQEEQMSYEQGDDEDDGDDDEGNGDRQDGEDDMQGESQVGEGLGHVVGRMRQLATAHNHTDKLRRSRREKAAMRGTFRGVLAVIEKGAAPTTKVKLQYSDVLIVDTLEGNIMLTAVKKFLAGGFQVHMQCNPLLHECFNFTPSAERPARLSALEKRHTRSPSSADSKWRTAERKGDRQHKASRYAPAFIDE